MNNSIDYQSLKAALISRVMFLRQKCDSGLKSNNPRFVVNDKIVRPDGKEIKRRKIILTGTGCCIPTCTMCPFPNKSNHKGEIVEQVRKALSSGGLTGIEQISLYNDGSFFAPAEISETEQLEIAKILKKLPIKILSLESLPQFIIKDRLEKFKKALGNNINLEIGIGLQSADHFVREVCINSSFSNNVFENSIQLMKDLNIIPKIYILIKAPFLSEEEAINDALNSLEYLKKLHIKYVTVCPVRVVEGTLVWDLYQRGLYVPPNLWTVYKILKEAPSGLQIRVAGANLTQDDFNSILPHSCLKCNQKMIAALTEYKDKKDLTRFPKCNCQNDFNSDSAVINPEKVAARITDYLAKD